MEETDWKLSMPSNSLQTLECRPGMALSPYVSFGQLNTGNVLPYFGLLLLYAN